MDQRSHIIAVHANYYGPLREGEYQFAFGGSTTDPNGSTIDLEWDYYRFGNNCNVFTIVTKNPEIKDIASFKFIVYTRNDPGAPDIPPAAIDLYFDRDPTNVPVSEGDIINIRSDCNFVISEGGRDCIYLVTILLELDPL